MTLSLDIQDVVGDLARPNLFEVEISYLGENLKFQAKAASLPASVVNKIAVGYQNRKIGYGGDRTYEDWTITVYNDEQQIIRRQLLEWGNLVQNHGRVIKGAQAQEYKQAAFVRQFNRAGEKTAEFKLTGVFPTTIAAVTLDWDTNDAVETFDVTFHVDWLDPLY